MISIEMAQITKLTDLVQHLASDVMRMARILENHERRVNDMATTAADLQRQMNEALQKIDGYTTSIAADLTKIGNQLTALQSQITNGTAITPEQLQPIVDAVLARSTALAAVAASADSITPADPPPIGVVPAPTGTTPAVASDTVGAAPATSSVASDTSGT